MKICFMGTPDFACEALNNIIDYGFNISCVYTKAEKARGRGNTIQRTSVHNLAIKHNIRVLTPNSLKDKSVQEDFIKEKYDICIVASYGLFLPKSILSAPKYGCINIHASLLPKWRGASPIHMSIANGDKETGITIMQMDVSMDSGDILLQRSLPISTETTFTSLYKDLSTLGGSLVIDALNKIFSHNIKPIKQNSEDVTYAPILKKEDGEINFQEHAKYIEQKVRAFIEFPTSYFYYNNEQIKITKASFIDQKHNYTLGEIVSTSPLIIAAKDSLLDVQFLQRPGKKSIYYKDFLRGFSMDVGNVIIYSK
jgi:methionyl-tRNA formyltransferase